MAFAFKTWKKLENGKPMCLELAILAKRGEDIWTIEKKELYLPLDYIALLRIAD